MCESAPLPRSLPVLALAFLAGCASLSSHQVPSPDELRRIETVVVETVASGTVVRYLASRDPAAPEAEARPLPRIELGSDAQGAITEAVVGAGACETRLRFVRAGEPGGGAASATLEVKLLSVTLAAGTGADPLTALWLRFQTRVALPSEPDGPSAERSFLDAAHAVAVDPRPRPLSEWLAGDGAKVRETVSALSVKLAPSLVADLRGGSTASCGRGELAVDAGGGELAGDAGGGELAGDAGGGDVRAGDPATSPSQEAAHEGATAPVQIEFLSTVPRPSRVAKTLRSLGGGVAGIFVGGMAGAGACAKEFDRGAHDPFGATLFALCAIVAMPVGAMVGVAKGVGWAARHEAALRAEHERKVSAFAEAAPAAIEAAVAGPSDARAGALRFTDGETGPVRPTRVRLLEEGSDPPVAALELELGIGPETDEGGAARRVCLRGPGPVPTELWFQEDAALLRASIEAQLERGLGQARSGLDPQPGDGPCGEREVPAQPGPPPRIG